MLSEKQLKLYEIQKLKEEIFKLKNVIAILKDKIFVEQLNQNEYELVIESDTNAKSITQEEYDLLEEVLGVEKED